VDEVTSLARQLQQPAAADDSLMEAIGEANIVLIGEASHGTRDFYRERAEITKRLITEKGFDFVAVEADWPDAYNINRFVKSTGNETLEAALSGFERFPRWMWRNIEVADFVTWLRAYNQQHTASAGFYGLDLYSLYASMEIVLRFLESVDADLAQEARVRYACFDQVEREPQAYGFQVTYGRMASCEDAVVEQLRTVQSAISTDLLRDARASGEEPFSAEQNARLVRNAEAYYRAMYQSEVSSWNLRDTHMFETLETLLLHGEQVHSRPKAVVWAHNSHLGNARATEMSSRGELNLGQLVRDRFGSNAFSIGFSTFSGHVSAAHDWGDEPEQRFVRPAPEGSYERLFHETGLGKFLLLTEGLPPSQLLQRAIGVIYRPETERMSHYFQSRLRDQFDAIIHIDQTEALRPLDVTEAWQVPELPTAARR
jgi:erythromycin esterase-like protein